MLGKIIRSRKI